METYNQKLKCTNCGQVENVEIKKGIAVPGFICCHPCTNCGCYSMTKYTAYPVEKKSFPERELYFKS